MRSLDLLNELLLDESALITTKFEEIKGVFFLFVLQQTFLLTARGARAHKTIEKNAGFLGHFLGELH